MISFKRRMGLYLSRKIEVWSPDCNPNRRSRAPRADVGRISNSEEKPDR